MKKLLESQGWGEERTSEHLEKLIGDFNELELTQLEKASLRYARKLTVEPSSITASDVGELRKNGATDSAIHDLCAIVAYFNFVNRIADGLGVELEGHES